MNGRTIFLSLVVSSVLAAACSREARWPAEWSVKVDVQGQVAVVAVDVPGKRIGRDYHPHLGIDDGPEIMMYSTRYTLRDLPPGPHRLRVVIADPQHAPIPGMEKVLSFEIGQAGRVQSSSTAPGGSS